MIYLMVAGGLVLLLVGGDVLVRGAVALAQRLNVQPLVIGLTVVAFGTSAPELVVCVEAGLSGVTDVALGNVIGSNIANILLVIGLPALIYPISSESSSARRDGLLMLAVTIALAALCWIGVIGFWPGLVMVVALGSYLAWSYQRARQDDDDTSAAILDEIEGITARPHSMLAALGMIAGGLVGLVIGSHLLVEGAVAVARAAGVSEAVIGLTLVALGTSLPELATSLVAAIRRHGDVALGNVVGSNLFNILGILGITAMIVPLPVPAQFVAFDIWVMLAAALALMPFLARGASVGRIAGACLFLCYVGYVFALFHGVSAALPA